jgi:hypothetical protein
MGKRFRTAFAAAAIAAAALSFMQSNRGPWSSDPGIGVEITPARDERSLVLSKDAGTLSCWLRLRPARGGSIAAVTIDGHPLQVAREGAWFRVTDRGASTAKGPESFRWYAGGRLLVRGARLQIAEWEVYRGNGPKDSSAKERSRRRWFAAFIVLFVLATAGVAARIVWPEPDEDAPSFTPEYCVVLLIDTLEAKRPQDTRRMRELLKQTLLTHRVETVIVRPRERGLVKQGIRQLSERLDVLIETLIARRRRLG